MMNVFFASVVLEFYGSVVFLDNFIWKTVSKTASCLLFRLTVRDNSKLDEKCLSSRLSEKNKNLSLLFICK